MEVVVSNISILVNSSPRNDSEAHKGFKAWRPLSPFLFAIVVERLTVLFREASEIESFKGFNFKGLCKVDLLQFGDDTLIIGKSSWNNL